MLAYMKPTRTLACLTLMLPALALGADPVAPASTGTNGTPVPANGTPKAPVNGTRPSLSLEEAKNRFNSLKQYFTEDEWKQISRYLLDSVLDGLRGTEDATLAPDLAFRLEILKGRMMVEGNTLMNEVANQWQQLMTPPPPVPYEPRPLPGWSSPPGLTPVYTPSPAIAR